MGEVYRARDRGSGVMSPLRFCRANWRRIPIALGGSRVSANPASLNHPNIGAIYGLEHGSLKVLLTLDTRVLNPCTDSRIRRRRNARRPSGLRATPAPRGRRHGPPDCRRPRCRPRQGHRSPRSQASQHQDHSCPNRQGARLRSRDGVRRAQRWWRHPIAHGQQRPHRSGCDSWHGALHEPRTGAGPSD